MNIQQSEIPTLTAEQIELLAAVFNLRDTLDRFLTGATGLNGLRAGIERVKILTASKA